MLRAKEKKKYMMLSPKLGAAAPLAPCISAPRAPLKLAAHCEPGRYREDSRSGRVRET